MRPLEDAYVSSKILKYLKKNTKKLEENLKFLGVDLLHP